MKKAVLIAISFLIYSSSGVFCKLASQHEFLSLAYIEYLLLAIAILGIYAILWQRILAIMPLNRAFLCKSMCVIISLVYAHIIFYEAITVSNVIGAGLIIAGVMTLSLKIDKRITSNVR